MNEEKNVAFTALFVACLLCVGIGFAAGYTARGVISGRERDTDARAAILHQQQLDDARKKLRDAEETIRQLEAGIGDNRRIIGDAQESVDRASGLNQQLEATVDTGVGEITRIRSIMGLGDGGLDNNGSVSGARASEQRPP